MNNGVVRKGIILGLVILFVGAGVSLNVVGYNKNVIKNEIILNNDWTEEDKLLALDGADDDWFGSSVSIDGNYAIIGAYHDDDLGGNSGAAYIFRRSGTSWSQQAKLLALDGADDDWFGSSVSIDGDYAIIGAYRDDDLGENSGAAYIFRRSGTSWLQQAKLLPSDGDTIDEFGYSVSIDGNYAVIGAPRYNDNGNECGAAYVFYRSGSSWSQQAKLLASDKEADDSFGYSVSIDGDTVLIGAWANDDYGDASGSAYVFVRSGTVWSEQAKLLPSDGATLDLFGGSVSVNGDFAIVGSPRDDDKGDGSGSAYVFVRSGSVWSQQEKLVASDGAESDEFGYSLSIDGELAIIGSRYDDDSGSASGSAYIFLRNGPIWLQKEKLLASDGKTTDWFGCSVSIDGITALIGAVYDDDNGDNSGSAYTFVRDNDPPDPPSINGPTSGKVGIDYPYTFTSEDPEGEKVSYTIRWGDGEETDWTNFQDSGPPGYTESHAWYNLGNYVIQARAKDVYNANSNWSTLEINIPRTRSLTDLMLLRLYEQFKNEFIRYLIGLII
jgi:hypothetical protein